MLLPMTMALVVQRGIYRDAVAVPLGIATRPKWGWFLAAWPVPLLLAAGAFALSLAFTGVTFVPGMEGILSRLHGQLTPEQLAKAKEGLRQIPPALLALLLLLQVLVAGPTVNAVAAFGEELGWRGFLQRELASLGFWPSSLLIGAIWGLWHAPIIRHGYNYPQHPLLGIALMTVACTFLGPLLSYMRLRARTVFAAAVMHGSFNASAGLAIIYVTGGSDLTTGVLGLPGIAVLLLFNLLILLHDRLLAKEPITGRGGVQRALANSDSPSAPA